MTNLAYYTDQELPGIPFLWLDYDGSVIDFSSGWTFTLKLVRARTTVVSQTANITGSNGGTDPDNPTPNVTLSGWTSSTLAGIATDMNTLGRSEQSYELRLYARRAADSSDDVLRPGAPPIVQFTVAS